MPVADSPGAGPAAAAEVEGLQREIAGAAADRGDAPPAGAAERPEVHEGPAEDPLEREAAEVEAKLKARLQDLTREDVQDVLELAFSLIAIRRGRHWQLDPEESARIGLWVHKAVERHGVAWVGKWLPDLMAAGLLVYAVRRRLDLDAQLAEAPAATEKKPEEEEGAQ